VEEIRFKYEKHNISQKQLAIQYGVKKGTIQKIIEYRSWKPENNPNHVNHDNIANHVNNDNNVNPIIIPLDICSSL
jgi:hypothetical protein